ncbi:MAG: tRNA 2-thiouridine(34) synthase MnmA [Flavobacteriales bacterium]|jgi:tRNA-specific 2-thiouridylase
MATRVVVGLSGGVDSSVAAHLLLEQGFEVVGIFMRNWHDESVVINNECPWIDDSNDAMLAAETLGIPFQVLDMSKEYKERIVDYMFREYEAGRTPNPDVLCNREVKFDLFLKAAQSLKADFVATGHYCRKDVIHDTAGNEVYRLLAGVDDNKDQSYFLCQLNQYQLSKALFPIGHLQKSEVRRIAREIGLGNADKKDSQGLCFIGKVKLPVFLQQQLQPKPGQIIEVPDDSKLFEPSVEMDPTSFQTRSYEFAQTMGKVIGEHQGAHYYTVGQRKGLGIGGKALPLFILATDAETNTIYVGQGEDHAGLLRKGLRVLAKDIHWVREDLKMAVGEEREYKARIRYRQELSPCKLILREDALHVLFDEAQRGIAAGQFVAWYKEDELIGSGVIA